MVIADPAAAKALLRAQLRAARRDAAAEAPSAAEIAASAFPAEDLGAFPIVAGYRAHGSEIDPWPLMRRLAEAGARLALPAAVTLDAPLVFRAYAPGDALAPDAAGMAAPTEGAQTLTPDLVIVPLLGFDGQGGRIGQGGGHYDRTLAALRAVRPAFAIGLGYAAQEVARIPAEPHDQALDAILTEKGYRRVREDI
jgi:5-formyltetrahydrofolate cyclo-ligase